LDIEPWSSGSLIAETSALYGSTETRPVADLGQIVARIRSQGSHLRRDYGMSRIGVFGSFVTGEYSDTSDVDLLVEFDQVSWANVVDGAAACEDLLGRRVDLVREDALRPELRSHVLKEVLYVWEA
jgi:predicted nucleotidyltransferase